MSFKLLAIRPITVDFGDKTISCDNSIIKGLKKNHLYKFYNDYQYYDSNGNEVKDQDNYIQISEISYIPTVPTNLYGENINISAIVGQNGSGKSSLLELFYFSIFRYSHLKSLLIDHGKDQYNDNKNLCVEFYYEINNEIHCLRRHPINDFVHRLFSKKDTDVNKNCFVDENKEDEKDQDNIFIKSDYNLPIYNIVTNYSIYGLNSSSEEDKWLDNLFIKNDGYQTPIVITPYRENGTIDINREYELANSRLLKIFLSEVNTSIDSQTSRLIQGLDIDKLVFKLNTDKHRYIYLNEENRKLSDIVSGFELINNFQVLSLFKNLYKIFNIKLVAKKLVFEYEKTKYLDNKEFIQNCQDLSNLYIFKKITKIVYNYKPYRVFKPLFENKTINNLDTNSSLLLSFTAQYYKLFIKKSNKNQLELIELSKKKIDITKHTHNIKKIEVELLDEYYRIYDKSIKSEYENYRSQTPPKGQSIYEVINNFINDFNQILQGKEFRERYINLLLQRLNQDTSHVTLKLRQVLHMQESNFFNKLKIVDTKDIEIKDQTGEVKKIIQIIICETKKQFFTSKKTYEIQEIPNAFFEPIFYFKKKESDQSYELKYLSSGEQQQLHSAVAISYHIDNLLSVVDNKNPHESTLVYKAINIILDEIELYYHPEYQRNYIRNLIYMLSQDRYKDLQFNILFSTHSPFILSDIPTQNTLKLKQGISVSDEDGINSFGANIHDLLADEFYLEKGFIGEFVKEQIQKILLKDIVEKRDLIIIELIGDPFLKGVIKNKIQEKITKLDILEEQIKTLQEQITKLKK